MNKNFQVISPIDNSIYIERSYADALLINKVLEKAKTSQLAWKSITIQERAAYCLRAVQYLVDNADSIGKEITYQMGRPIRYTANEIKGGLQERAKYMIDIAEEALADVMVSKKNGFHRYITREALGTVLVLAPWNYPFLTSVNAIIPALMSGNTVILKHATQTPLCAERYDEAFRHAGLPEGVFQFLHLNHDQVAEIIEDERIDYVAFTGSVNGGQAVQKALNKRFINAGLELGGKDPAYVRVDADLQNAVENLVDGSFFNSGQSCCGIERIYVHEALFDDFTNSFVNLTKKYSLGHPLQTETELGPMVKTSAAIFVRNQIEDAVNKGAKALIDPELFPLQNKNTSYMAPQVMINVDHSMELMTEESFGPVVGIMAVKNDDEAIHLMNDSQYGLTASIWTKDLEKAVEIGNLLETGTVFMNRCDYLDPELAWTGVKNSGRGCTLSKLGYEALTRPKSFHLKT